MGTLSGKAGVLIELKYASAVDLSTVEHKLPINVSNLLTSGTGDNQADVLWVDQRTVGDGATDSLDLSGSLTDAFGATVTLVDVKGIYIRSANANTTNLSVGGNANGLINWISAATDQVQVQPDGLFLLSAPNTGYAVTAATGDVLDVVNAAGATALYDIVIWGTSA